MKFWEGYWKSLKPLEVEEPIDVWVHRPLAYLIARGPQRLVVDSIGSALMPRPLPSRATTVSPARRSVAASAR